MWKNFYHLGLWIVVRGSTSHHNRGGAISNKIHRRSAYMEENKNLQAGASHPVFFSFCGNILRAKICRYPQRNVLQYIKTTPQNYQAAVKPCGLKWIKVLHDRKKNKLGFWNNLKNVFIDDRLGQLWEKVIWESNFSHEQQNFRTILLPCARKFCWRIGLHHTLN